MGVSQRFFTKYFDIFPELLGNFICRMERRSLLHITLFRFMQYYIFHKARHCPALRSEMFQYDNPYIPVLKKAGMQSVRSFHTVLRFPHAHFLQFCFFSWPVCAILSKKLYQSSCFSLKKNRKAHIERGLTMDWPNMPELYKWYESNTFFVICATVSMAQIWMII